MYNVNIKLHEIRHEIKQFPLPKNCIYSPKLETFASTPFGLDATAVVTPTIRRSHVDIWSVIKRINKNNKNSQIGLLENNIFKNNLYFMTVYTV